MEERKMRTNVDRFRGCHGQRPRGFGSWVLDVTFTDNYGSYSTQRFNETGTLTNAKAAVVRAVKETFGKRMIVTEIEVMP
jgi:hypothetical protein